MCAQASEGCACTRSRHQADPFAFARPSPRALLRLVTTGDTTAAIRSQRAELARAYWDPPDGDGTGEGLSPPLRVAVAGGGPIGLRVALEMALLGHKVCWQYGSDATGPRSGHDRRVAAGGRSCRCVRAFVPLLFPSTSLSARPACRWWAGVTSGVTEDVTAGVTTVTPAGGGDECDRYTAVLWRGSYLHVCDA